MKNKTTKIKKKRRSVFIETALLSILLTSLYYSNSGRQKAILQQSSPSTQNGSVIQQF